MNLFFLAPRPHNSKIEIIAYNFFKHGCLLFLRLKLITFCYKNTFRIFPDISIGKTRCNYVHTIFQSAGAYLKGRHQGD